MGDRTRLDSGHPLFKDGEYYIVPENTRHGCMIRMDQIEYDAIMMLWELNPPAA